MDIGAERALVVRDAGGEVHVLRNSCAASPHALVAGRSGRLDAVIECKVHGLTFGLDGRALGEGQADLEALEYASAAGLMFARSAHRAGMPDSMPPNWADGGVGLTPLDAPIEVDVAADWKAVVEQWLEFAAPRSELEPTANGFAWQVAHRVNTAGAAAPTVDCWTVLERASGGANTWRRISSSKLGPMACRSSRLCRWVRAVVGCDAWTSRRCRRKRVRVSRCTWRADWGPFARRSLCQVAESIQSAVTEFGYESTASGVAHPSAQRSRGSGDCWLCAFRRWHRSGRRRGPEIF